MPMVDCPILQVDITTYWELYSEMFSVTGDANVARSGVMPSSGLLGLLATLDGTEESSRVDLYGFNWNTDKSYYKHMMSSEELIVQAVAAQFPRLRIHPTACNGLYHCEQLCDTGQFRTAVDEDNCQHQLAKARAGEVARFIDLHTTQHLDWHPGLRAELQGAAMKAGIRQPSDELLRAMARDPSEDMDVDRSRTPPFPRDPKAKTPHASKRPEPP